jgi:hypothetical protein
MISPTVALSRLKAVALDRLRPRTAEWWTVLLASMDVQLRAAGCTCDPLVTLNRQLHGQHVDAYYQHDETCGVGAGRTKGETWRGETIHIGPSGGKA